MPVHNKRNWFDSINVLLMIGLCCATIYPFLYVLNISISSPTAASQPGLHLIPVDIQFASYKGVFKDSHLLRSYANIIIVTVVGTFMGLFVSACAGFTLSKPYYPFRKTIIFYLAFTALFSGGIIPYYLVIKNLSLIDTWVPLWIGSMIGVFNIIILKSFFQTIPADLEEAARMDGASDFKMFLSIVLPLSKPVLATVGLWLAVGMWNDWLSPYLFINNPNKVTLPLVLRKYVVENDLSQVGSFASAIKSISERPTPKQVVATVIVVAMVPMLLVYPFIQRYFVKGIMLGSIKE